MINHEQIRDRSLDLFAERLQEKNFPSYPINEHRLFVPSMDQLHELGKLAIPEGTWWVKSDELHDTCNPAEFPNITDFDNLGRPLHPWHKEMLEDERIGVVAGKGFYWFYGANKAGDLAVIRHDLGEPHVLLIERKDTGDPALIGGMKDKEDIDVAATSLREAREEVHRDFSYLQHLIQQTYDGPLADLRATIHAWPETTVSAIVLPNDVARADFKEMWWRGNKEEVNGVWWEPVSGALKKLFGSHNLLLDVTLEQTKGRPAVYNTSVQEYKKTWQRAQAEAKATGLKVVEHGWEQHVIIDEANNIVRRYPRHKAALAKLQDEVVILGHLNEQTWPVPIPILQEFNGDFATYEYIPGNVLAEDDFPKLTDQQIESIGADLGTFLAALHAADPNIVEHKAWRQVTTLFEYYENRIKHTHDHNTWKQKAMGALCQLQEIRQASSMHDVVVHGDLHGLNMVLSENEDRLNGVIDLSEIELGDPHQDFRKIFMTDPRLLVPAIEAYETAGGKLLNAELVKLWAYVNEWSNLCHFADKPDNATFKRAHSNLKKWNQL